MPETPSPAHAVPAPEGDATRRRDWPALAALGVASAVWTATYLRHSYRHGRLGLPPLYDDVTYLLDGARRVAGLREGGIVGLVQSLAEYPPKSLISTIHATAAFLIFGVHDWAPYLFNVFVVFAILTAAERAIRPLPVWPRVAACLLLLGSPMLGRAVNELRPDFYGAFAIGAATFAMLDRPLLGSPTRRLFLLGFLVGVSIAAKPTATPAALVLAGVAFCMGACIDLVRTEPGQRAARVKAAAGWIALGALVLPLLYAPFGAESTWNYVENTLLGPNARLWTPDLTPQEGLLYYITGTGGQYMLGRYALPLVGLALFGLGYRAAIGSREDRWRSTALFALLLLSWALPTLTPVKHGLFGLQFYALLMLFAARGMREVWTPLLVTRRLPLAIPIAAVTGAAAIWLASVKLNARALNPRSPRLQEVHALRDQMYEAIRRRVDDRVEGPAPGGTDVLLTFTGYINWTNLQYLAVQDRAPIRFESRDGVDRPENYAQRLGEAEMVLALTSGTGHEIGRFPSLRILDETIDMLDAHPEFERAEMFHVKHLRPGLDKPGRHLPAYILYVRRSPPAPQPTASPGEPAGAPPP